MTQEDIDYLISKVRDGYISVRCASLISGLYDEDIQMMAWGKIRQ